MLNFSPRLRDTLTREFWIEKEMLTSRIPGTRSRAQRTRSPDGSPDKSTGQVRGRDAPRVRGTRLRVDAERKGIQGRSVSGTEAFGGDLLRNLGRVPIGVLLLKGGGADGSGGVKEAEGNVPFFRWGHSAECFELNGVEGLD